MVIDSSALVAIILSEPDYRLYIDAIDEGAELRQPIRVPAATLVEVGITATRRDYLGAVTELIEQIQAEIVPLTAPIAELSIRAFGKFGKGMHKAGLNFGDCMSYATAEYLNEPLLYKGNDFSQTPIRSVLLRAF